MSNESLTTKYRPQTFAQVAGQNTLKAILSRAALEDKTAPAYLFSGTRGVGKTTLARIFAKALNCRQAPSAEPCNACDQCRSVALGNAVDVIEIDGASNRGIDDIRRLKEVVGYAPMEGRYKIFIIDEAHMLSREAFNALLKTLEEPPARVTFIMATTEPHKFPATIVSRCQHYVFKRLPESELAAHLASILTQEGVLFDQSAIRLIARRGAGSVRDAMSLLGQVLALGSGTLTESSTRSVLGLAGQEMLIGLATAVAQGKTITAIQTLHELMDQGLDIGFFLREFGTLWRNMFILGQSGEAALAAPKAIDLPQDEAIAVLELSRQFSLSHIHAAWQMTLEGQRRVLTSLEPGVALELLLLNLAMLPQLLSLDSLSAMARRLPPPAAAAGTGDAAGEISTLKPTAPTDTTVNPAPITTAPTDIQSAPVEPKQETAIGAPPVSTTAPTDTTVNPTPITTAPTDIQSAPVKPKQEAVTGAPPASTTAPTDMPVKSTQNATAPTDIPSAPVKPKQEAVTGAPPASTTAPTDMPVKSTQNATAPTNKAETPKTSASAAKEPEPVAPMAPAPEVAIPLASATPETAVSNNSASESATPVAEPTFFVAQGDAKPQNNTTAPTDTLNTPLEPKPKEATGVPVKSTPNTTAPTKIAEAPQATPLRQPAWNEIVNTCKEKGAPSWFTPLAGTITASWSEGCLCFQPKDAFSGQRMMEKDARAVLEPVLLELCGAVPDLRVLPPLKKDKARDVIKQEVYELPLVKELEDSLDARVLDFGEIKR